MIRLITLNTLLIILFCFSPGYAQEHAENPYHDYFTADQDPSTKLYLWNVTMAHTDKILTYIREGRVNAAVPDVKYTLDRFPNHPKGLELAGLVGQLTKNPSLAIYYYERALRLFPQYAVTHAQFGVYLVSIGRADVGISKLKKAIEIDPNLAIAYARLASAYSKNGNMESARQAAERARALGYKGKIAGQDLAE